MLKVLNFELKTIVGHDKTPILTTSFSDSNQAPSIDWSIDSQNDQSQSRKINNKKVLEKMVCLLEMPSILFD